MSGLRVFDIGRCVRKGGFVPGADLEKRATVSVDDRQLLGIQIGAPNGDNWGAKLPPLGPVIQYVDLAKLDLFP